MSDDETPGPRYAGSIVRAENLTIGYQKPLASNLNLNVNSVRLFPLSAHQVSAKPPC